MDVTRQSVTYRIEPKPGGGFIARTADPTVPAIEAPTQEELTRKIQAEVLGTSLSGLKIPSKIGQSVLNLCLEHKPGRTLTLNSTNGDLRVGKAATQEDIENFAMEFGGIVEKNFPEIGKALAARIANQGITAGSKQATDVVADANTPRFNRTGNAVSNAPITPETNSSWKILMLLLALMALGALMYLSFYHR